MPKFANLKPKEVVRALERAGFYIHETTGSHVHLKHPDKPGRITVPYYTRFDLPKHIVKSIIRQAGLTNKQFFEAARGVKLCAPLSKPHVPLRWGISRRPEKSGASTSSIIPPAAERHYPSAG